MFVVVVVVVVVVTYHLTIVSLIQAGKISNKKLKPPAHKDENCPKKKSTAFEPKQEVATSNSLSIELAPPVQRPTGTALLPDPTFVAECTLELLRCWWQHLQIPRSEVIFDQF